MIMEHEPMFFSTSANEIIKNPGKGTKDVHPFG